jgi:hypothetical protein
MDGWEFSVYKISNITVEVMVISLVVFVEYDDDDDDGFTTRATKATAA